MSSSSGINSSPVLNSSVRLATKTNIQTLTDYVNQKFQVLEQGLLNLSRRIDDLQPLYARLSRHHNQGHS
jgi:hypothetical protein